MKKGMRLFLFGVIFLFISMNFASAHQPRIVMGINNSVDNPTIIKNPEISQAFYGELCGGEDYYRISSEKGFLLYLSILSPDVRNARKDFNVDVIYAGKVIQTLDSGSVVWERFYEEFGGDWYWQGPSFEKETMKGDYIIRVYNDGNRGKYSLAVGKTESFPAGEALNAIVLIPQMKIRFFEGGFYSVFQGIIMRGVIVFLLVIILIIVFVIWIIKTKKLPFL
jgi:hypothetical protein